MSQRSAARSIALIAAAALTLPTAAHATFPGQNGALAYSVSTYDKRSPAPEFIGGPGALFTAPATAGATPTAIPDERKASEHEPAWSPDGQRLAYVRVTDGKSASTKDGIYVTPAGTHQPTRIVKSSTADGPTWTPDGASIVFSDLSGLSIAPADGSTAPQRIVKSAKGWIVFGPTVTPDGATIVFSKQRLSTSPSKVRSEIWAVDRSGGNERRLIPGTGSSFAFPMFPDVSPDGTSLLFSAIGLSGDAGLWVSKIDGSKPTGFAPSPGAGVLMAPTWSPDGKHVAASLFQTTVKKGSSVVTIDVATGTLTTVVKQRKAYLQGVSWQPLPILPAG